MSPSDVQGARRHGGTPAFLLPKPPQLPLPTQAPQAPPFPLPTLAPNLGGPFPGVPPAFGPGYGYAYPGMFTPPLASQFAPSNGIAAAGDRRLNQRNPYGNKGGTDQKKKAKPKKKKEGADGSASTPAPTVKTIWTASGSTFTIPSVLVPIAHGLPAAPEPEVRPGKEGESAPKVKKPKDLTAIAAKPVVVAGRGATCVMFDHVQATRKPTPVFVDNTPAPDRNANGAIRRRAGPKKFVIMLKIGDQEFGPGESLSKREARYRASRMYLEEKAPELDLKLLADFHANMARDPREGVNDGNVPDDPPPERSIKLMDGEEEEEEDSAEDDADEAPAETEKNPEAENVEEAEPPVNREVNVLHLMARISAVDHRVVGTCRYRNVPTPGPCPEGITVELDALLNSASRTAELKMREFPGGPAKPHKGKNPPVEEKPTHHFPILLEHQQVLAEANAKQTRACEQAAESAGKIISTDLNGKTAAEVIVAGGGHLMTTGHGRTKKEAKIAAATAMLILLLPQCKDMYSCHMHLSAMEEAKKERRDTMRALACAEKEARGVKRKAEQSLEDILAAAESVED